MKKFLKSLGHFNHIEIDTIKAVVNQAIVSGAHEPTLTLFSTDNEELFIQAITTGKDNSDVAVKIRVDNEDVYSHVQFILNTQAEYFKEVCVYEEPKRKACMLPLVAFLGLGKINSSN